MHLPPAQPRLHQPLLALLDSPLAPLLLGAATGRLADVQPPRWKSGAAVAVVMASAGYPESSSKGDVISGIGAAETLPDVHVIHAGTALGGPGGGELVTAGGRVLAVIATGDDVAAARAAAYDGVAEIAFDGAQSRSDIALHSSASSA